MQKGNYMFPKTFVIQLYENRNPEEASPTDLPYRQGLDEANPGDVPIVPAPYEAPFSLFQLYRRFKSIGKQKLDLGTKVVMNIVNATVSRLSASS